jgi:membrane protein
MAFWTGHSKRAFAGWQMTKDTINGFMEDNCLSRGASIAYFTIFSLAPILLVVIAIAGFVFGEDAARGVLFGKLKGMLGPDAAGLVQSMIQSASNKKSGIIATVVSIVMLLVTASGVFGELQSSLNAIWKADPSAHGTVTRMLKARAQSLGLIVTLGFLMLVTLAISAAISAAWNHIDQVVPGASSLLRIVNFLVSFCVTTVLFGAVYKVLPDKRIEWRDVFIGSVFTALLYTIGKTIIARYIGSSSVGSSYGAASALVVLLLWVYYSAQIFLLGAEFTKVYAYRHGSRRPVTPGRGFWNRFRPQPMMQPIMQPVPPKEPDPSKPE